MSAHRVAIRYARAFVDALQDKNALDQAKVFLDFCDKAAQNSELTALFGNVTISNQDKTNVVSALSKSLGLPQLVDGFLKTVAQNGRLNILSAIRDAVIQKLDETSNIQSVDLTTAAPLTAEELSLFETNMGKALGRQVRVNTFEDAAILGGAIAQVGSHVYDGSVRGQLSRLRAELVKES